MKIIRHTLAAASLVSILVAMPMLAARRRRVPGAGRRRFRHQGFPLHLRRGAAGAAHALPHAWARSSATRSGKVRNAVLILHGTGGERRQLPARRRRQRHLRAASSSAPGQPLDATRYFIVLPDGIGHGKSSQAERRAARPLPALRLQRHDRGAAAAAHRGPRRESPAPRARHLHGRHAHLGLGRDATRTSWTRSCRSRACPRRSPGATALGGGSSWTRSARTRSGAAATTRRSRLGCAPAVGVLYFMSGNPLIWPGKGADARGRRPLLRRGDRGDARRDGRQRPALRRGRLP